MSRHKRIHPLTKEVRHYLADQFSGIHSDLVDEAFPGIERDRRAFRVETLIEGIVRSLSRLSGKRNTAPLENLLVQAGEEVKEVYPSDRHPLIDRLIAFISPALLGEAPGGQKRGAA